MIESFNRYIEWWFRDDVVMQDPYYILGFVISWMVCLGIAFYKSPCSKETFAYDCCIFMLTTCVSTLVYVLSPMILAIGLSLIVPIAICILASHLGRKNKG